MGLTSIEKFFHEAAIGGEDLAEQLKKIVNSKDLTQVTPLHKASSTGNLKMVKDLIQLGAEIEAKDEDGMTSLLFAVSEGKADVVKYLIEMGAQIEEKTKIDITPLHLSKNHEITKILIQNGANIEATAMDGITPLHAAAEDGQMENVKCLIHHGAQIDVKNIKGQTAFDLADEEENFEIAEYLLVKKKELESKNPPNHMNDQADCIICLTPRNGLYCLYPCGHTSLCEPCCYKLKRENNSKCPSCREFIKGYTKIFFQEPE